MSGRSTDIASAYGAVAVTPSDSTNIPGTRGLEVGVAGNLAVRMVNGDIITLAVTAGERPLQVNRVYSTGTTATGITALY